MLPTPAAGPNILASQFSPHSALPTISHQCHCPLLSQLPSPPSTLHILLVRPVTPRQIPSHPECLSRRKTPCFRQACKAFYDPAPTHLPTLIHHGPFLQFESITCSAVHREIGIPCPNKGTRQSWTGSDCTTSEPLTPCYVLWLFPFSQVHSDLSYSFSRSSRTI